MNPFKVSVWSVRFTIPKGIEVQYAVNLCAAVVAPTAERVSAIIREAHPTAVIYAINHKGNDVTYLDPLAFSTLTVVREDSECPDARRYPLGKHRADAYGHCVYCGAHIEKGVQSGA